MKKIIIYSLFMLLCACSSDDSILINKTVISPPWYIAIVDSEHNDRLDPKSPSYFGEEYIQKIDVLTPAENNELVSFGGYLRAELENNPNYPPEFIAKMIGPIVPPGYSFPEKYYTIPVTFFRGGIIEDGEFFGCTFIRYPNGSEEDIIKFQDKYIQDEFGSVQYTDKIWVNDELVFESKSSVEDRYYNPKYFPRMIPVLDDDGIQRGMMPDVPFVILIIR